MYASSKTEWKRNGDWDTDRDYTMITYTYGKIDQFLKRKRGRAA